MNLDDKMQNMKRVNDIDFSEKEDETARYLPPRTDDPRIIARIFQRKPVKVKYGFCNMCDSDIHNDWMLNSERPYATELRHVVDNGVLRKSELSILIDALESGELDYFWTQPLSTNETKYYVRIQSAINFAIKIFTLCNEALTKATRKIYVWRTLSSRKRWYKTRNNNLYNPIFQATVYDWYEG